MHVREYNHVKVAGTAYRMHDVLDLEPEPDNPHDANAVRVIGQGIGHPRHIGYLPAVLTDLLAYNRAQLVGAKLLDAHIDLRRNRVTIEIRVTVRA
jgi:hypothetical protein